MELQFRKDGNIGIIHVKGRIDAGNVSELKTNLNQWLNETNQFLFDLSEVDFIDSTGLGGIVACLKYISEANGVMKIANLQTKPRMIFEITRAYKIFDIFDDVETALKSFQAE
jgi:anti-sigma B factor antagonist